MAWISPIFTELLGQRSFCSIPIRIVYVEVFEFIFLFSILMGGLILVNLLRLLPHTRGVWQRIRTDWTQLSFLLSGGLVLGLVVAFDEYHHSEVWRCTALACLALCAWLYLWAGSQKRRILADLAEPLSAPPRLPRTRGFRQHSPDRLQLRVPMRRQIGQSPLGINLARNSYLHTITTTGLTSAEFKS